MHACCLYSNIEERQATLEAILSEAGAEQAGIIYLYASGQRLSTGSSKLEPSPCTAAGVASAQGRFVDVDFFANHNSVLAELRREIDGLKAEGWHNPEIITEMCCPAGRQPGAGELIEFESKLDAFLADAGARCTCFYNKNSDSTFLLGILSTHPHAIVDGKWCDNLYYTPPPKVSQLGRPAATLDQRLKNLAHWKSLEEALRDSEARYRKLVEPNIMGIMSIQGAFITDANDAFLKTVGYTREQLGARRLRWGALTPPEFRRLDRAKYRELLVTGSWTPFEKELLREDGTRVSVLIGGSLLEGYKDRVVCFVLDITDRKRTERAERFLAEAGTLLASSLDYEVTLQTLLHSAVPVLADWCAVDLQRNGVLERVAVSASNPLHERLLQDLAEPPHKRGKRQLRMLVFQTGRSTMYSEVSNSILRGFSSNPSRLAMLTALAIKSVIMVPLLARGNVLGVVTMATAESGRQYGASDLALAEELARRAALAVDNAMLYQESQLAIKARDEFFSAASHELKTPITSLRGYAQFMARHIERQACVDRRMLSRTLEVIDQQSERLTRLVNNLLDVSRIEAGKLLLECSETDVSSLVKTVVIAARQHTSQRRLYLKAPKPVWGMVDAFRLEQVVANLLDNAMKYSPQGEPVHISVSAPDRNTVRITVSDQGIGITPEHREHIFERFYQAHNNGHYGGIGVGLFIANQIVVLHSGRIDVESTEAGTRFVVSLPAHLDLRQNT